MIALFRKWIAPVSASERILIDGGILRATGTKTFKRSLRLARMNVYVPDCRSYVVEFRRDDGGEFLVDSNAQGGIALRSLLLPHYAIPVCWLPRRMLGSRVHRYIVRIDLRRVRIRAGLADNVRIRAAGSRGAEARPPFPSVRTSSAF